MAENLWVREDVIDADERLGLGESGWYESYFTTTGQAFRELQKLYGRCISKMYREPTEHQVGWVFQGRAKYDDCDKTYLREVWVELSTTKPEQHMTETNITSPF
jgi:hypothetical protein